jgi:hypothetical protein
MAAYLLTLRSALRYLGVLGTAYLVSGRNLWTCVLTHGFIDTVGLFAVYLGWES